MIHYRLPNQDAHREREGFSAIEMKFPAKHIDAAEITLTSKYPEKGWAVNTASEMVVRILEGEVRFCYKDEEVTLSAGSTIFVEPNKPYCWIPNGVVKLFPCSSPPWTAEQHTTVN